MKVCFNQIYILILFTSVHFFFSTSDLKAQNFNNTVTVVPFSTSFETDYDDTDYSRMLTETILTSVVQTQRFIMVDRTDLEKVLDIKNDQRQNKQEYEGWENVSEAHLVEAGKQLGVEYIFAGNISNVSVSPSVSGLFRSEFGFTIKVIAVETSKIYVTESFSVNSDKGMIGRLGGKDSKREALNAALQNVVEPVQEFIDKYFPIEVKFFKEKELDRKGLPKSIIIEGGLTQGLRNGQELDLMIVEKASTFKDKIGEVRITGIDADYATCKVLKGEKDLGEAIRNNPEKIIAQSQAY